MIEGKAEKLLGLLQEKYGYTRDKTEKEYEDFIARYREPRSGQKIK